MRSLAAGLVAFCASLVTTVEGADPLAPSPQAADALFTRIGQAAEKLRDYTCIFTKQERVHGELHPLETTLLKQRREPRCVYMKWVEEPHKGRELIYCPAKYGDELKVHEGSGVASWMTLSLDPKGGVAMRGNRHSITEAGLFFTVEEFGRRRKTEPPTTRLEGPTVRSLGGRSGECLMVIRPEATDEIRQTEICIDAELALPIAITAWNAAAEVVEHYRSSRYELDVGLTDLDFDTENPAYDF